VDPIEIEVDVCREMRRPLTQFLDQVFQVAAELLAKRVCEAEQLLLLSAKTQPPSFVLTVEVRLELLESTEGGEDGLRKDGAPAKVGLDVTAPFDEAADAPSAPVEDWTAAKARPRLPGFQFPKHRLTGLAFKSEGGGITPRILISVTEAVQAIVEADLVVEADAWVIFDVNLKQGEIGVRIRVEIPNRGVGIFDYAARPDRPDRLRRPLARRLALPVLLNHMGASENEPRGDKEACATIISDLEPDRALLQKLFEVVGLFGHQSPGLHHDASALMVTAVRLSHSRVDASVAVERESLA
jgi:hypothetical protein